MITKKRLEELHHNILASMGWNAKETKAERIEINKVWDTQPGNTSFHDTIKYMGGLKWNK